jgi:hypothetical protein
MSREYPSTVRKAVAATVADPIALWIHNQIEERNGLLARTTAARVARQSLHAALAAHARPYDEEMGWCDVEPGTPVVALIIWQRDCDCCEGYSRRIIRADIHAYDAVNYGDDWEGPHSLQITDPAADWVQPRSRDRVLEAYENGNSYFV